MSSEGDKGRPKSQCDLPVQERGNVPHEENEFGSDLKEVKCELEVEFKSSSTIHKNSSYSDSTTERELSHDKTEESKTSFELSSAPKPESDFLTSDQLLESKSTASCSDTLTDIALDDHHVAKDDFLEQETFLEKENPSLHDASLQLQNLTMIESGPPLLDRESNNTHTNLSNTSLVRKTILETLPDLNIPNLSQPPPPLPSQAGAPGPGSLKSPLVHTQNSITQQPFSSHHQSASLSCSPDPSSSSTCSQFTRPLQVSTQIPQKLSSGNSTASPQHSPTSQTGPTVCDGGGIQLVPSRVQGLLQAIFSLQSPDDLQVHSLASQLRAIDNEAEYRWLCEGMCSGASNNRRLASVVGAVCREAATHTVGSTKLRTLVFRTAQQLFANHENLALENHEKFVTCAIFLGEIFYYVRSEAGTPFAVLAEPLVTVLKKILQIYLEVPSGHTRQHNGAFSCTGSAGSSCNMCSKCGDLITKSLDTVVNPPSGSPDDPTNIPTMDAPVNGDGKGSHSIDAVDYQNTLPDGPLSSCKLKERAHVAQEAKQQELTRHLDGDMMVVAKQLLQNGESLQRICPDGVADIVQAVTELLCRCCLSSTATLQVCAALAEMWPWLCTVLNPRTSHAVLASRMGLSLNL